MNISTTGVLIESGRRVEIDATVRVEFEGTFSPSFVQGRVARCGVATIDQAGKVRFHVGITFNSPLALEIESEQPAAGTTRPQLRPGVRNRW